MRCNNCGWENNPGASRCIKCNAPLDGSMAADRSSSHSSEADEELKATLRESSYKNDKPFSSGNFRSGVNHTPDNESGCVCVRCGYPIAESMNECPRCHTLINRERKHNHENHNSNGGNGFQHRATENPWANPSKESFCTLKRIPWQTEPIKYEPVSYSGQTIILNRANTDENNNSITSKEQAVLMCENGEWFIENRSEMKTTLVRVDRRVKLEDGDVIVLGNRMFEFRKG